MEEYSYVYTGGKLMQMVVKTTTSPAGGTATTVTETLNFTYDASGIPMSVNYNGTDYYYVANIQGDVMAILNTSGSAVVSYTYDAWGKLYSTTGTFADTLGEVNPLTYRGYVYDHELGLYYLQSRYYNPEVGRFINADGLVSTGQGLLGNNMFAYCLNNAICMIDNGGTDAIYVVDTAMGDGLPVVGHALLYVQDENGQWYRVQYCGKFPLKSTAWVEVTSVDERIIEEHLNNKSVNSMYIHGDFSESLALARDYKGGNYGGYHLFDNNCLHFAKEILDAGDPLIAEYKGVFSNKDIIPALFYYSLTNARREFFEEMINKFEISMQ